MQTVRNPFIVSGYVSADYFCDRKAETAELTGALVNGRNIVIVSPRRMGKTGLIEHCFHQKEIAQGYYTFFVDIYATGSLKELVFMLGKHIFDTLKPKGRKFVEGFFAAIGSLRPAFKLDAVSGEPVFDIGIGEIRKPEVSLEELFAYLEAADKPCLVAIDEFQQIARYPEKNVEAVLRTHIQKCTNTNFVFAGSQRHMMQNIFFSASRPFYQSASFLNLGPIEERAYHKFVREHFEQAGKRISDECIARIYGLFEGHTWYMQTLLNRLYEQAVPGETIIPEEANSVLHATVDAPSGRRNCCSLSARKDGQPKLPRRISSQGTDFTLPAAYSRQPGNCLTRSCLPKTGTYIRYMTAFSDYGSPRLTVRDIASEFGRFAR